MNEMPDFTLEIPNNGLPDPAEITYYVLEKERKLYLDFDIDDAALSIQKMILRWNMEDKGKPVEERKPIWLYILSSGGAITHMWAICDAINLSKTPIYTVNVGLAASAASLIFISGHKRFMFPKATVLIHEGSAELSGDAIKVMDQSEAYRKSLKQMKEYILQKTNIPPKELNKKRANDWELSSDYCMKNGVCDILVTSLEEII